MPADADVAAETDFGFSGDCEAGAKERQQDETGTRGGFSHGIFAKIDDDSRP